MNWSNAHLTIMGMMLFLATTGNATEFETVQKSIVEKNSTWKAQPSPFSSDARKIHIRAGAADEDEPGFSALNRELENLILKNQNEATGTLPAHFDWRNYNDKNFLPQSPHQGSCGSCVSFASIAALEGQLNIACGTPERSFNLSRQFFFSCGGGLCKQGWKLSSAMTFLQDSGVPDTPCMPYGSSEGSDIQCSNACSDYKSRTIDGLTTIKVTTGYINVDAIKQALLRGPLVANMILYEDLEFYRDGVYRHVEGNKLGNHAIVLAGWNDADNSWIVMNSWGPQWGQGGFFKVARDDVSLPGRYTWSIDVQRPLQTGICNLPR